MLLIIGERAKTKWRFRNYCVHMHWKIPLKSWGKLTIDVQYMLKNRRAKIYKKPGTLQAPCQEH